MQTEKIVVAIVIEREMPLDRDDSYDYDMVRDITAYAEMEGWVVKSVT